jgi:ubiquinone/menaquinone biosynthesis C-methylase UbiE
MGFETSAKLAGAWRDPEFWGDAWGDARGQSLMSRQRPERAGSEHWNRSAARFAARTQESDAVDRIVQHIHMLGHKILLKRDSQVLDIGSGPGNYAIPIARQVRQVVALDPATEMLEILNKRAAEAGLTNIVTVRQAWEDVDLDQADWRGAFDMVLAAMAPPFNGVANLQKMLAACRGLFVAGGHLQRDEPVRRELWQELGLGELPDLCPDPFYAYHWLYASGYYPDLTTEQHFSLRQLKPAEAQAELEDSVYPFLDLTPDVREQIRGFVERRVHGGVFLLARSDVSGWVTCQVGTTVPQEEQSHIHQHDHDHGHPHEHSDAHGNAHGHHHHDHEPDHGRQQ